MNCFACGQPSSGARFCRCGAPLPRFSTDGPAVSRDLGYAGETVTSSFGDDLLGGLRRRQVSLSADEFAAYLEHVGPLVLEDAENYLASEEGAMAAYRLTVVEVLGREHEGFEDYVGQRRHRLEQLVYGLGEAFEVLLDSCETGDEVLAQQGMYLAEQAMQAYASLDALHQEYAAEVLAA